MAVLKSLSRLQIDRNNGVKVIPPVKRVDVQLSDAEKASRHMLVAYATVKVLPTVGKPLRAQKWYEPDYRSATKKGTEILNPRLRGVSNRWSAN